MATQPIAPSKSVRVVSQTDEYVRPLPSQGQRLGSAGSTSGQAASVDEQAPGYDPATLKVAKAHNHRHRIIKAGGGVMTMGTILDILYRKIGKLTSNLADEGYDLLELSSSLVVHNVEEAAMLKAYREEAQRKKLVTGAGILKSVSRVLKL